LFRLTVPKKRNPFEGSLQGVVIKNQEGHRLGSSDAPSTSVFVVVVVGYGVVDGVVLVRNWLDNVSSRVGTRGSKLNLSR
jgi:hypothetical protein